MLKDKLPPQGHFLKSKLQSNSIVRTSYLHSQNGLTIFGKYKLSLLAKFQNYISFMILHYHSYF